MPTTKGLFDSFDNLDQLPLEAIAAWLKPTPNLIQLENYLANKILYPQTLPLTEYEMKIDLAILREALKINGPKAMDKKNGNLLGDDPFINVTLRKLIIPERFLPFAPNIVSLAWAFVDGLLIGRKKEDWFQDLWTVVVADDFDQIVGSILLPQFSDQKGVMELNLLHKDYKIRPGSLMVIPCPKERCELVFRLNKGTILGKQESAVEIYGGDLGVMIDSRSL